MLTSYMKKDFYKVVKDCSQELCWSAFLYGNEVWILRENEMGIWRRTERSMVIATCGVGVIVKKLLSVWCNVWL